MSPHDFDEQTETIGRLLFACISTSSVVLLVTLCSWRKKKGEPTETCKASTKKRKTKPTIDTPPDPSSPAAAQSPGSPFVAKSPARCDNRKMTDDSLRQQQSATTAAIRAGVRDKRQGDALPQDDISKRNENEKQQSLFHSLTDDEKVRAGGLAKEARDPIKAIGHQQDVAKGGLKKQVANQAANLQAVQQRSEASPHCSSPAHFFKKEDSKNR